MRLLPLLLGPVAVAAATSLHSQTPGRPTGYSVTGIVVDSIYERPLSGAEVVIVGTEFIAVTDSSGRFTFDSIPPGDHRIAFFHPFLDSISVATAAQRLTVPLEAGKAVLLAVPSAGTLIRAICQTDSVTNKSLLVGHVSDPETTKPVSGASIFVTWTDFEVKKKEISRTPQTIQGSTDNAGVYRVCGIPAEVEAVVYAMRDSSSTSRVAVSSTASRVIVRNLMLENPESAMGRRASVGGIVRTRAGEPIGGANVSMPGSGRTTSSDSKGAFTLDGLPLGTRNVVVRRLGFVPANIPVDLKSGMLSKIDAVLQPYVLVMDPIYVIAQRDRALSRLGFTERRRRGLGDFRQRSDFEKDGPNFLSDIVGKMRGVRVEYVDGRRVLRAMGQGAECVHMVVDGVHWESTIPGDLDDAVVPQHVAAIEVYSGAAVPPEFENGWARGCLTIVVWTRTKAKDLVR